MDFAARYPARTSPLSTLGRRRCRRRPISRGLGGSLLLSSLTLSFITPRRCDRRTGESMTRRNDIALALLETHDPGDPRAAGSRSSSVRLQMPPPAAVVVGPEPDA